MELKEKKEVVEKHEGFFLSANGKLWSNFEITCFR